MKKIFNTVLIACTIFFGACHHTEQEYYMFTSFNEPATEGLRYLYSKDGITWDSIPGIWLRPYVGTQKIMRDPSMVRTPDGTFHLVWTSSWRGDRGFGYASSRDLINWSEERFIPVMDYDSTTVNVWAPELFYDDVKEQLMVVWASCIPGKFERGMEDEKNNHRLYYVTTKDFQTFSETKLFYEPGFSVIDAVVLKMDNKKYAMVLKDNTRPNRNLKMAFADSPEGPWSNASEAFTGNLVEGPSIAKVGDRYYVYFDAYGDKMYGAMSTIDFVHFKDETKNISIPKGHKHGTIFKVSKSVVDKLIEEKNNK